MVKGSEDSMPEDFIPHLMNAYEQLGLIIEEQWMMMLSMRYLQNSVWVNRKFNMEEERGMIPYLEEHTMVIVGAGHAGCEVTWPVQDWVWKRLCLLSAWTA